MGQLQENLESRQINKNQKYVSDNLETIVNYTKKNQIFFNETSTK